MVGGSHHRVVEVKRETLESCMTCPLCNKLLKEATTISLCLHTFCRKCIYGKLSDEGMDCCPICDIELGCLPVDKLRPDHSLQEVRAKIFPYKRRKISAPEVMPSASPPAKRKERSLSSLVVSTPKVPMQRGLTGRRTKATARKRIADFRWCSFSVEGSPKKEDSAEDHSSGSTSPDSSNKISQRKRQDCSGAKPSSEHRSNEDTDDVEIMEGKADLWTSLNCLVEAANRKSSKLNSQASPASVSEPHNGPDRHLYAPEIKAGLESPTVPDGKNGANLITKPVKRRRLHAEAQKKAAASNRIMLDTLGSKWNTKNNPIWFSLVACEDRIGHISLPQLSACYLRIGDGKMPVSFILKYLVKKLDLTSEAEVEIMCQGQPVVPSLQLHSLVDYWFRTASTAKKIPATVGSSAKDFVMVLSYCRKVQAP
ncbi:E3 ubiquitin protein ligase DRIP2-like isoform X2 [Hibiscus syriacus]|uniref:E3 ubiquitin protein ligase DRIP2-like isoform X2 n=1 Tax=Hibiscus syriacus TaxID=106335 RepID=UPI0019228552|nr:E3 ubiquitin protein ligase DRIP2-like isoform X2 [Hibiscus syriacus]